MGVILDVVYNHLYSEDTLEKAAPESYMRRRADGKVSFKSGAGASLESRNLMTRRLIIDSLKWWKDFYGVDGFRFDLMGFTDLETMRAIRQSLGSDSILYGEAWEFTDLPKDQATTKSQIPKDLEISAFNDTSRDSYTGHMQGRGFIQGESHELPKVRAGLVAGFQDFPTRGGLISKDSYHLFAKSPMQALNFLTIHDGPTLWDKINLSFKGSVEKRKKLVRQSFAMLLTSQGRIILHGGMEFGRSKPLAENDPNPDRALTSSEVDPENGVTHFHENSYRSPDTTNSIKWERKEEFLHELDYLKKLIELRRKTPALRYLDGENLKRGLHFLGNDLSWPPAHSAGYESFKEAKLDELEIQFINASTEARNKRWYVAGEIHPEVSGGENKNPLQNPWYVDIDNHGKGILKIKKQNLAELDLESWSDPEGLQFKLISTPGKWDTMPGSYTTMGNNTVKPLSIDRKNQVTIDLQVLNHEASRAGMKTNAVVAYRLDNTLEVDVIGQALPYSELLVVHSGENKTHVLRLKDLNPVDWKIILDGENINLKGLSSSQHKLSEGKLEVAPQSSAVLVKFK